MSAGSRRLLRRQTATQQPERQQPWSETPQYLSPSGNQDFLYRAMTETGILVVRTNTWANGQPSLSPSAALTTYNKQSHEI
jgi:hypothetical protein